MRLTTHDLEIEQPKEPFEVELGDGTVVTFPDIKALPFDTLMNFGTLPPMGMIKVILGDEAFDAFSSHDDVTGYFMEYLMKQYSEHYGVVLPGEANASRR